MLFVFSIAVAKNKPYQVSVIIFKHITKQALQSEQWKNEAKMPSLTDSIYLKPFSGGSLPALLPNSRFRLKRELSRLQKSNGYQILTYFSWIQDFNQPAPWIHVTGGQTFDPAGGIYELNGKIKVALNVYFNLYTRLYLTETESVVGHLYDKNDSLYPFSMNQNRRLQLNEVNYLDHPLFGMLVKINPIS